MYERTNIDGFYKDTVTGLVINKNINEYIEYKKKLESIKKQKNLEKRVEALEYSLSCLQNYIKVMENPAVNSFAELQKCCCYKAPIRFK